MPEFSKPTASPRRSTSWSRSGALTRRSQTAGIIETVTGTIDERPESGPRTQTRSVARRDGRASSILTLCISGTPRIETGELERPPRLDPPATWSRAIRPRSPCRRSASAPRTRRRERPSRPPAQRRRRSGRHARACTARRRRPRRGRARGTSRTRARRMAKEGIEERDRAPRRRTDRCPRRSHRSEVYGKTVPVVAVTVPLSGASASSRRRTTRASSRPEGSVGEPRGRPPARYPSDPRTDGWARTARPAYPSPIKALEVTSTRRRGVLKITPGRGAVPTNPEPPVLRPG